MRCTYAAFRTAPVEMYIKLLQNILQFVHYPCNLTPTTPNSLAVYLYNHNLFPNRRFPADTKVGSRQSVSIDVLLTRLIMNVKIKLVQHVSPSSHLS